ncbi:hypothetical protein CO661_31230 [Sinorhizobium fredii]|uniref:Uncharacterized protein n=1 Tax=Rhizobium fredii TaxID=380 RepID=A0A2A6LNB9_RHIFR|nr:hypothetical protein CO661_31230 [Sinorhizobium fredii]
MVCFFDRREDCNTGEEASDDWEQQRQDDEWPQPRPKELAKRLDHKKQGEVYQEAAHGEDPGRGCNSIMADAASHTAAFAPSAPAVDSRVAEHEKVPAVSRPVVLMVYWRTSAVLS